MEKFKHKTTIQIRFKDVDMMGHVNNANHFTYFEYARVQYFDDIAGGKMNWSKKGIILAKSTIDYKMPILFRDKVFVHTRCARMGNKSFDLAYKITKEENGTETILAEGSTVLVCFDYDKHESIPIPEEWKKAITEFEK